MFAAINRFTSVAVLLQVDLVDVPEALPMFGELQIGF